MRHALDFCPSIKVLTCTSWQDFHGFPFDLEYEVHSHCFNGLVFSCLVHDLSGKQLAPTQGVLSLTKNA